MQIERFMHLAEAYGGDIGRWPAEVQDDARRLAESSAQARTALAQADALDMALDAWRVAGPSAALREAVLAQAPRPWPPLFRRATLWLSGVGLAAACAAGAVAGVAMTSALVEEMQVETVLDAALTEEAASPIGVGADGRIRWS